jgi:hypothetical protein
MHSNFTSELYVPSRWMAMKKIKLYYVEPFAFKKVINLPIRKDLKGPSKQMVWKKERKVAKLIIMYYSFLISP